MSEDVKLASYQDLIRAAEDTNIEEGVTVSDEVEDILADYTALVTSNDAEHKGVESEFLNQVALRKLEVTPLPDSQGR